MHSLHHSTQSPFYEEFLTPQVGRMMMNIGGLIFDGPDHTIHLQTLETLHFRVVAANSDSGDADAV